MHLTIVWLTARREGCWNWFVQSLNREAGTMLDKIRVVRVDFHATVPMRRTWITTPPKPTVWQGPYRLTKNNYFAASNARNTGICFAKDGWIAFVDDLSVLMPGWLTAVRRAMRGNYIVCGAFRKVLNLKVKMPGAVPVFDDHPAGHDSRWEKGVAGPRDCPSNWLFGCSVAGPVDAWLKINGWPEICDSTGVGCEDCLTGEALSRTGHKLNYDQTMLTLESEEGHHKEKPMLRLDKGEIGTPNSKSHALVRTLNGCKWFHNDFGEFPDLAALRKHVLKGGDFPVLQTPAADWFDGQKLSEL
jgi:hypothetical protein